jgi:beta-lactam-binding protein with PASTA domain
MRQSIAKQAIRDAGFSVGTAEFNYSDIIASGDVMSQSVTPGTIAPVGSPIDIVISFGPPEVPYIVGMTEADANSAITLAALVKGTVVYEYNDVVAAGLVMRQSPEEDTVVSVGTGVDMAVSLGQPIVPHVVGVAEANAVSAIEAVSLTVGLVTYEYSDDIPASIVISQDPNGGTTVGVGSSVNIIVSLGQPIVPNVLGMTEPNAISAITSIESLSSGNITYEYHNTVPQGLIISQDPNGGTAVPIGSTVDILVSLGRPIVPDVVNMFEYDANSAITAVTLSINNITYEYSDTVEPGHVISQIPVGGTEVTIASTVDVVIAYAIVPRVVGISKSDANSAITNSHLVIGNSTYEYSDTTPAGVVISQNPTEGTLLQIGNEIDLLVSMGEPLVGVLLGGDRLVEQQNQDGGWEWPLSGLGDGFGDPNSFGLTTVGLAQAYRRTEDTNMLAALEQAKGFLLSRTENFTVCDGLAAVELDSILDDSNCMEHLRTNFYDKLEAGTYYVADTNTIYDTNSYVEWLGQKQAEQGVANLGAFDLGIGLYSAHLFGSDRDRWLMELKSEIDQMNSNSQYDILGLAGVILGLAGSGEDYDPQSGSHASASNVYDLADFLTEHQLSTGGFTWHWMFRVENLDESIRETVYAAVALAKLDRERYMTEINDAVNYLQNVQLATGGWEHYSYAGEDNEITGEAIRAISVALPITGDFNNDDTVDMADYAIFALAWLSSDGDANWNPACDLAEPANGVIDVFDLAVFFENWLASTM